jgi:hypothetical protein
MMRRFPARALVCAALLTFGYATHAAADSVTFDGVDVQSFTLDTGDRTLDLVLPAASDEALAAKLGLSLLTGFDAALVVNSSSPETFTLDGLRFTGFQPHSGQVDFAYRTSTPVAAPELDAASVTGALILLLGGLTVLRSRVRPRARLTTLRAG